MLTVLKANVHAFEFYVGKLKYELDMSSPSLSGGEASFEILSKCVDKAGVAAIEARLDGAEAGGKGSGSGSGAGGSGGAAATGAAGGSGKGQ
jgi:hypothetical protein